MISDMQGKIIKAGAESQRLYAEFAEFCEDRSRELHFEIKTAKAEIADHKAVIEKESADGEALETKIGELAGSIGEAEEELKKATAIRKKEAEDFVVEEKDLMDMIDSIVRAAGIIN